jgi:transposase
VTTDLDLGKLSHAEKDALILSLVAQLQAALARIGELEKRVAELQRPPKTPDNSSMPPSQGQKPNTAEPGKAERPAQRQRRSQGRRPGIDRRT